MAVYCSDLSLLFIQNARTGCSALGRLLVNHYGGEYVPKDQSKPWKFKKHASLRDIRESGAFSDTQLAGMYIFSAIRNPFDSIASVYQKRLNWAQLPTSEKKKRWWWRSEKVRTQVEFADTHSFDDFVDRFVDSPTGPKLSEQLRGVDFVMRFEQLQQDYETVMRKVGATSIVPIPIRNRTEGKRPFQSYYSERSKGVIERVYERELEAFGYSFTAAPQRAANAPKPCRDRKTDIVKFVVLAQWRTGSTLLVNLLSQHPQIAAHREVFNPQVNGRHAGRGVALRHWLGRLSDPDVDAPPCSDIAKLGAGRILDHHVWHEGYPARITAVGLKVLAYQWSTKGRFPHLQKCLRERMHAIRPIVLTRDNLLAMHVSFQIAKQLGQWNVREERLRLDRPSIEIEPTELESEFRWYDAMNAELKRVTQAARNTYSLSYEEFVRDKANHWRKVCDFLDVDPIPLPRQGTIKLESRTMREAISNYDELAAYFAGSPWARFFDE